MNDLSVGDRLRALRGIQSQSNFADECDLSRAAIGPLEKLGSVAIRALDPRRQQSFSKIAAAHGLSFEELCDYLEGRIELCDLKLTSVSLPSSIQLSHGSADMQSSITITDGEAIVCFSNDTQRGHPAIGVDSARHQVDRTTPPGRNEAADKRASKSTAARKKTLISVVSCGGLLTVLVGLIISGQFSRSDHRNQQTGDFIAGNSDSEQRPESDLKEAQPPQDLVAPKLPALPQLPSDFYSVTAVDKHTVFAVGSEGAVFKTVDGFHSWVKQDTKTDSRLLSAHFLPGGKKGWAVGANGKILMTTNQGSAWTSISHARTSLLHGVYFDAAGINGFAVGEKGTVLTSRNSGKTWSPVSQESLDIASRAAIGFATFVYFVDENNGWILGEHGNLLHTRNGGDSWDLEKWGDRRLWSICFYGRLLGWMVGEDGVIFHTQNGGESWHLQAQNEFTSCFHGVSFVDEKTGWIVGGETILSTVDGGAIWNREKTPPLPPRSFLCSIAMADQQNGWAVGKNPAVILRRTDTGWIVVAEGHSDLNVARGN